MLEAALWSLAAASALLIGTQAAFALRPRKNVVGLVMAFGAGAMISAIAYNLVLEAVEKNQHFLVVLGMALGSGAFFVGESWIERPRSGTRKSSQNDKQEGSPLAIVLGAVLDGLPESVIIGLSVVLNGSVSLAFVSASFISNLSEAMSASTGLTAKGWSRLRIFSLWSGIVGMSVVAGAAGYLIFNSRPESSGAFVEGFAAGALLTLVADAMTPEAFLFGGELAGIFTVAGFTLALALGGA